MGLDIHLNKSQRKYSRNSHFSFKLWTKPFMRKYFETQEQLKQKLLLSGVVLELYVAALPLHGVFYCLVSSENSLPNDASVVDGDLLKFAPCMPWGCWCATDGLCNWHSVQSQRGLLKSASSLFELFAVTGSIRETRPDQKNMPNHSILHPHDILSRVDGGAQLDLREKHSSSMRVCQTPADFPGKML